MARGSGGDGLRITDRSRHGAWTVQGGGVGLLWRACVCKPGAEAVPIERTLHYVVHDVGGPADTRAAAVVVQATAAVLEGLHVVDVVVVHEEVSCVGAGGESGHRGSAWRVCGAVLLLSEGWQAQRISPGSEIKTGVNVKRAQNVHTLSTAKRAGINRRSVLRTRV